MGLEAELPFVGPKVWFPSIGKHPASNAPELPPMVSGLKMRKKEAKDKKVSSFLVEVPWFGGLGGLRNLDELG